MPSSPLVARLAVMAALLMTLAARAAATAQGGYPDKYSEGRVVLEINRPDGSIFRLRLPKMKPSPAPGGGFRRTYNDTCGLFDIAMAMAAPKGFGPAPHVHYADDEWFILAGTGKIRMYTHQQARVLTPGQLPGFNIEAVKAGSAVISTGDVLYSPRGAVHYFAYQTDAIDFINVHASGFAMETVIEASNTITDPQQLLEVTGLYGVPTDSTGRFVGLEDYRSARGPVDVGSPQLKRLQRLFDKAHECNPNP